MKFAKQFFHFAKNTWLYFFSNRKRIYSSEPEKCLYLDLNKNPFDRYLHLMLVFFALQGYQVRIRWRWGLMSAWSTSQICEMFGQWTLVWFRPSKCDLALTDRMGGPSSVFLDTDYFTALKTKSIEDCFFMPMPMVDSMYYFDLHNSRFENHNRKNSILFAGRMGTYVRGYNSRVFGIEERDQVISSLRNSQLSIVESVDHCNRETDLVIQDRSLHNIGPQQWRALLADFDFFLALPGFVMPLSHNIVEAMSVGTIPIVSYADWLFPKLHHEINCIAYSSGEIVNAVKFARSLTRGQIQKMRENVLEYYKSHLEVSAVIKKIENQRGLKKIYLVGEYSSTTLYQDFKGRSNET